MYIYSIYVILLLQIDDNFKSVRDTQVVGDNYIIINESNTKNDSLEFKDNTIYCKKCNNPLGYKEKEDLIFYKSEIHNSEENNVSISNIIARELFQMIENENIYYYIIKESENDKSNEGEERVLTLFILNKNIKIGMNDERLKISLKIKYNCYINPSSEILEKWNNKLPTHSLQIPKKHFNSILTDLMYFSEYLPKEKMKIGYLLL